MLELPEKPERTLPTNLKGTIVVGGLFVMLFLMGFMSWAALVPIDSGAIASGILKSQSNKKTIRNLDRGLIVKLLVQEGSTVKAGDPLYVLDDTSINGELNLLKGQLARALLAQQRLLAEEQDQEGFTIPEAIYDFDQSSEVLSDMIKQEQIVMQGRKEFLSNQKTMASQQIMQLEQDINALEEEIEAYNDQLALLDEEVIVKQKLFDSRLINRDQLMVLKRDAASLRGDVKRNKAMITKSYESINETTSRLYDTYTNFSNENLKELTELQETIDDLRERIIIAERMHRNTHITAPVSGTVINLQVFTKGVVVTEGQVMMEIVPLGDQLIIEARVDPLDIDVVYPGLESTINLSAFNNEDIPPLKGTVKHVSPDAVVDQNTGLTYYNAQIEILDEHTIPDHFKLFPGMPAEVLIKVGQRTTLAYLLDPITQKLKRSLRAPVYEPPN